MKAGWRNAPLTLRDLAVSNLQNTTKRINDNNFTVTRLQENGKRFKVVLPNDNGFPSCECADWKNNMLPCKHMFAIFGKIDGLDWNSFSVNYRNSPYFCLDINNQILDKSNKFFQFVKMRAQNQFSKIMIKVYTLKHYPKSSM